MNTIGTGSIRPHWRRTLPHQHRSRFEAMRIPRVSTVDEERWYLRSLLETSSGGDEGDQGVELGRPGGSRGEEGDRGYGRGVIWRDEEARGNGMKEINATTVIRRQDIEGGRYNGIPGGLREIAFRQLANALANELMKIMEVRESVDPETGDILVRSSAYVSEPGERVSGSYGRSSVFEVPRYTLRGDEASFPELKRDRYIEEMTLEPPPESPNAKRNRERYDRLLRERIEREQIMLDERVKLDGYINFGPGGITITEEPDPGSVVTPPATLTKEKLNEAVEQLRGLIFQPKDNDIYMSMINPLTYLEDRMNRKRAAADGEASAVAKACGEREVRENTKRRGATVQIEIGVRKITMPDKKEAG